MKAKIHLVFICVCLMLTSLSSSAGTLYWTNNTGGTFGDAANWSAGVPGSAGECRCCAL